MNKSKTIKRDVCKSCEHLVSEHNGNGCNQITRINTIVVTAFVVPAFVVAVLVVPAFVVADLVVPAFVVAAIAIAAAPEICSCTETFESKHTHKFKKCLECGDVE